MFYGNAENSVRSATVHVHFVGSEYLILYTMMEQHDYVIIVGDLYLNQVRHSINIVRIPLHFQPTVSIPTHREYHMPSARLI